jgi:hypothetical protein
MDDEFLDIVGKALSTLREKRKYERLATLPIRNLSIVYQLVRRLSYPTDTEIGKEIYKWLRILVEQMRPEGEPILDDEDWLLYLILKHYYIEQKHEKLVFELIRMERSTFFDWRPAAVKALANIIWRTGQERALTNLHDVPDLYTGQYVIRYKNKDAEYIRMLAETTLSKDDWIITLTGDPGVGKTKIAYETAKYCYEHQLFDTVVAIWIKEGAHNSIQGILNTISMTLGKRSLLDQEYETQRMGIYELMKDRHALLLCDDLDYFDNEELPKLHDFLRGMRASSTVLLTSRTRESPPLQKRISVEGMQPDEANKYILQEASRLDLPEPKPEVMEKVYKASMEGVPAFISLYLGIMSTQGMTIDQAISSVTGGEQKQNFDSLLDNLLRHSYNHLSDKHPNCLKVLHVFPIFKTPVQITAIAAAADLTESQCDDALGQLHRSSLVRSRDNVRDNAPHDLLPITHAFLLKEQRKAQPDSSTPLETIFPQKFLHEAHFRLAGYYVNDLNRRFIGDRVKYLGTEEETILALLEWCQQNGAYHELIQLVYAIGQPLGMIGHYNSRLKWGKAAIHACRHLPSHDSKVAYHAWFLAHDIAWTLARQSNLHPEYHKRALRIWNCCLKVATEILKSEGLPSDVQKTFKAVKALTLRNLAQDTLYHYPEDVRKRIEAFEYLNESLQIWEDIKDPESTEWAAHTMQELGWAFYLQKDYQKAYDALHTAHGILNRRGHQDGVVGTLAEMALTALKLHQTEKAIDCSERAIRIAEQLEQPAPILAYALWRQAQLDHELGKPREKVIEKAQRAAEIANASFANRWANEIQDWLNKYSESS